MGNRFGVARWLTMRGMSSLVAPIAVSIVVCESVVERGITTFRFDVDSLDLQAVRFQPLPQVSQMFAQDAAGGFRFSDDAGVHGLSGDPHLDAHGPEFGRRKPQSHDATIGSEMLKGFADALDELCTIHRFGRAAIGICRRLVRFRPGRPDWPARSRRSPSALPRPALLTRQARLPGRLDRSLMPEQRR